MSMSQKKEMARFFKYWVNIYICKIRHSFKSMNKLPIVASYCFLSYYVPQSGSYMIWEVVLRLRLAEMGVGLFPF